MSVTQDYKKRHIHCSGECVGSHLQNFAAAVGGSMLIAAPFVLWLLQVV